MPTTENEPASDKPAYSSQYSHSYQDLPVQANTGHSSSSSFPRTTPTSRAHNEGRTSSLATTNPKYAPVPSRTISADSPYFLGMSSPYPESSSRASARAQSYNQSLPSSRMESQPSAYTFPVSSAAADQHTSSGQMVSRANDLHPSMSSNNGAMMIESHNVDMSTLQQQESFPFSNGEILPWLEYLPQDVLSFFGETQNFPLMSPGDSTPRPPP